MSTTTTIVTQKTESVRSDSEKDRASAKSKKAATKASKLKSSLDESLKQLSPEDQIKYLKRMNSSLNASSSSSSSSIIAEPRNIDVNFDAFTLDTDGSSSDHELATRLLLRTGSINLSDFSDLLGFNNIINVRGDHDHIDKILSMMGLSFHQADNVDSVSQIIIDQGLTNVLVFVNCGSSHKYTAEFTRLCEIGTIRVVAATDWCIGKLYELTGDCTLDELTDEGRKMYEKYKVLPPRIGKLEGFASIGGHDYAPLTRGESKDVTTCCKHDDKRWWLESQSWGAGIYSTYALILAYLAENGSAGTECKDMPAIVAIPRGLCWIWWCISHLELQHVKGPEKPITIPEFLKSHQLPDYVSDLLAGRDLNAVATHLTSIVTIFGLIKLALSPEKTSPRDLRPILVDTSEMSDSDIDSVPVTKEDLIKAMLNMLGKKSIVHSEFLDELIRRYINQSREGLTGDRKIPMTVCIFMLSLSEYIRKEHNIRKSADVILAFLMKNSKLLPEKFKSLLWKHYTKRNFMYLKEMLDLAKMQGLDTMRHDLHPNALFRKFMEAVITNIRPKDVRNQMLSNNQKKSTDKKKPRVLTNYIRGKRLFKTLHLSSGTINRNELKKSGKDGGDVIEDRQVMLNAIFTGDLPPLTEKTKTLHRMSKPIVELDIQELSKIIKNSSLVQLIRNLTAIVTNKHARSLVGEINAKFSNKHDLTRVKLPILTGAFVSLLEKYNDFNLHASLEKQIAEHHEAGKKGLIYAVGTKIAAKIFKKNVKRGTDKLMRESKIEISASASASAGSGGLDDDDDDLIDSVSTVSDIILSNDEKTKKEYLAAVMTGVEVAIWNKAIALDDRLTNVDVHVICDPNLLRVYKFDHLLSMLFILYHENTSVTIHSGKMSVKVESMCTSVIAKLIRRVYNGIVPVDVDPTITIDPDRSTVIVGGNWARIKTYCETLNEGRKLYWLPLEPNKNKLPNLVTVDALEMVISQGKFEFDDGPLHDISDIEAEYRGLLK
jgi:hypothetical protein